MYLWIEMKNEREKEKEEEKREKEKKLINRCSVYKRTVQQNGNERAKCWAIINCSTKLIKQKDLIA